jgi:hypothetical protein
MSTLRFACVVVFVLVACEGTIGVDASSKHIAARSQQPGPVCSIFFLKDKYVTTEGDPFVVAVEADCPPGAPNDAMIEFALPPPRFVTLSYIYRSEISALKLILFSLNAAMPATISSLSVRHIAPEAPAVESPVSGSR